MNFACSTMFDAAVKVSFAFDELIFPVQPSNTWPASGSAVMEYELPSVNIWPFRFGVTVPLPSTVTMIWLAGPGGGVTTDNRNVVLAVMVPSVIVIVETPD